jgi:DNA-binding response OmpR family regulator
METIHFAIKELTAEQRCPKLLLVDDDTQYRDMVVKVLQSSGLEVIQAGDGYSALEAYAREHRDGLGFDLVLLDLGLPRMNGSECLRRLREIDGAAKVIITSGYDPMQELSHELQALATGFLQKPFSLKDLLTNVRRLIPHNLEA